MVHVKIILDKRRKKTDGTYSINYRITDIKKVYTIYSGISVEEKFWDDAEKVIIKKHPNNQILNATINKKYYEIQKAILQFDDKEFVFETLKLLIDGKAKNKPKITFLQFSNKLINEMMEVKRTGNAIVYQTAVNKLMGFYSDTALTFEKIDYALLNDFKQSLIKSGLKINSIGNYFRSLRAIYNKAIKAKIVDRSYYPFHDITIKTERTAKRAITRQDIAVIEQLDLKINSQEWHARNYFLLSFYLIGISFTDLAYLKISNIVDGRLEFRRRKTHKLYSIKIQSQAQIILDRYSNNNDYLLPIMPNGIKENTVQAKKVIYQWIKTTNKYLKRMGGNHITTYVARHTWATTAKRLGYSNELIAEGLGHEYGNRITNIYLAGFDQTLIDDINKNVISNYSREL